jgi:hypothetical protein
LRNFTGHFLHFSFHLLLRFLRADRWATTAPTTTACQVSRQQYQTRGPTAFEIHHEIAYRDNDDDRKIFDRAIALTELSLKYTALGLKKKFEPSIAFINSPV